MKEALNGIKIIGNIKPASRLENHPENGDYLIL